VKRKKRKELTPEQREAGQTWVYPSRPESRYAIRGETPTTTVLLPPETYRTWLPIAGPERPYVIGTHEPRVTDVTLVKAPPSVRAELRERQYQEQLRAYEARRASTSDLFTKLFGVQTRLAGIEYGLREQVLIMEQRKLGFELVEKRKTDKGFEYVFDRPKGIAQRILEFDIPTYFADVMGFKGEKREKYLGITSTLTTPIHLLPSPFGTPVESIAGLVAYPETLTHVGMGMFGVQMPTRPPPSPGISKGYTMGYAMGTVGTSLLIGKAIEISPLGKPLAKAEMWIMSKIRSPITGTWLDKFLLEHSKYWATLQEYKAGTVVFGAKPTKWGPRVYHGKTTTPMSVTLKKAISDTSGRVLLPQLLTTPKTLFTLPETILPGAFLPQIIGLTTVLGLETLRIPKVFGLETLQAPKPISLTKLRQKVKPKQIQRKRPMAFSIPVTRPKEREKLIPFSGVIESLTPVNKQIEEQIQSQSQIFKQVQKQIQQQTQISPRKLRLKFEMPKLRRKQRGLFGAWFKRTHPIKTPEEMWRTFTGKPMRIKKRKKKKGKTRKKR